MTMDSSQEDKAPRQPGRWLGAGTRMRLGGDPGAARRGPECGSEGTCAGSPSLGGGWRRACSGPLVPTPALPHTPMGKARCRRHAERGCICVKPKCHRDTGTCAQAVLLLNSQNRETPRRAGRGARTQAPLAALPLEGGARRMERALVFFIISEPGFFFFSF